MLILLNEFKGSIMIKKHSGTIISGPNRPDRNQVSEGRLNEESKGNNVSLASFSFYGFSPQSLLVLFGMGLFFLSVLSGCAAGRVPPAHPSEVRPSAGPARRADRQHSGAVENSPELTDESDIEDYFNYALKNNESISRAYAAWAAAAERPRQARSLPDPRLSFQADDSFESRELAVSQTFPWYGKRGLRGQVEESGNLT